MAKKVAVKTAETEPETQQTTEMHFVEIPEPVLRDLAYILCLHGSAQHFSDSDQAARAAWDLSTHAMKIRNQMLLKEHEDDAKEAAD